MKNSIIVLSSLLIAIISILVIFGLLYKGNSPSIEQSVLYVGTDPVLPPFEFKKDGEVVGFDIDLMHAIGKYLKKNIIFEYVPFNDLLKDAYAGRIQVIASGITPTPQRSKDLFFTDPYVGTDPFIVITRVSDKPNSIADLYGKDVIVNTGYTAEKYLRDQGITSKDFATPESAFDALFKGRAYAYVSARSIVQSFLDHYGHDKFNIFELPVADTYALAVPKKYPEIFESIKKALHALEADGTVKRLKQQWHLDF